MLGIPWPKGWTIVEFFGYPASEYPLKLGVAPHFEIWAPFLRLETNGSSRSHSRKQNPPCLLAARTQPHDQD